ncbi:MAG TPA: hypothetical protein VH234_05995 [Candidatus Saccharimonadales bacterium]|jgi:hypothetical protein|nr:hypothetical protein [Candidatus Saccharimonadales bacterium]
MAKKSGKVTAKKTASVKTKSVSKPKARPVQKSVAKPRQLKPPKGRWQRLRYKHPVKLPSAWKLTKATGDVLWQNRKLFIGITLVYGLLNLILVQGLASSTDVGSLKGQLNQVFTGHLGALASSLSIFAVLVGSAGNGSSQTAGAYQLFLALLTSLAVIWALRQVFTGAQLRIRDAYYRGIYPLVPFILVLLVIGLQLLPFLVGSTLYSTVINNGIAVHAAEKLIWALVFAVLALWSFYMLSSSLFALYIVTLPDMTPLKALRSARELVRFRRWTVLRKVLCLPIVLLVVAAVIMVPIIIWLTPLAQWIFFLLTMFALVAAHTYMYTLYRELLNE